MALNRAKVSTDVGLSGALNYVVSIDYFDSAAPTVVLWQEVFNLPSQTSTAQLQALVISRGQVIRDALAALAAARIAVPNGTTVTVP